MCQVSRQKHKNTSHTRQKLATVIFVTRHQLSDSLANLDRFEFVYVMEKLDVITVINTTK